MRDRHNDPAIRVEGSGDTTLGRSVCRLRLGDVWHEPVELLSREWGIPGMHKIMEAYAEQMAEEWAKKVDDTFWLVVRPKPWWMPAVLYRAVIKNLIVLKNVKK